MNRHFDTSSGRLTNPAPVGRAQAEIDIEYEIRLTRQFFLLLVPFLKLIRSDEPQAINDSQMIKVQNRLFSVMMRLESLLFDLDQSFSNATRF